MTHMRKALGAQGEELAIRFLQKKRYAILHRNYRGRCGEIDIIARRAGVISFIEVKTRRSKRFGPPQDAVTPAKQRTISRVALEFLQRFGLLGQHARFDVIAVVIVDSGHTIDFIENAFDCAVAS
jgi:putative endonuclease